jgi:hypothetical protein
VALKGEAMTDMTLSEAEALLDLAETVAWFQRVKATVRFYADPDGSWVRVACRTDPHDLDVFTSSVQPVADDSAQSLAVALTDAGVDIVAQVQRTTLTVVR